MILETTFVLDFLKGKEKAFAKMQSLVDSGESLEITTPTIFEIWGGFVQLGKGEKGREKIISFTEGMTVYSLDEESAKVAGIIDGKLVKDGFEINTEDSMIAGIAITNNKKILTSDNHFDRIEGLKVERY